MTPEDRDLLAELEALLRRCDPVPPQVRADAEAAFALASVMDDWRLLEPVADLVPMRAGARSFRSGTRPPSGSSCAFGGPASC